MPGTDPVATLDAVLHTLGPPHVPFLPELPERGVGADMIGRGAAVLVDMPVDLQPAGWRLVDHPGRDAARSRSWWRQDLDVLSERADGYGGPLLVAVAGPWTLTASIERPRGGVVAGDRGARRDVADSLAEGVAILVADLRRAVPGAQVILQLDEPSLPGVLAGRLPTQSGFGRLPAVEPTEVETVLARVVDRAREAGAVPAVHCCAPDAPIDLLARCGPAFLGLDVVADVARGAAADPGRWESIAAAVERGVRPVFGVVDPRNSSTAPVADERRLGVGIATQLSSGLTRVWRDAGMAPAALTPAGIGPSCGLVAAGRSALPLLRLCVAAADAVAEAVADTS